MCCRWLDVNTGRKKSSYRHHRTTLSGCIFANKARIDNREKHFKQQYLFHMSYNMVNFGPLTAEICWRIWGTPANFNGFRVLAALLHGTLVVDVSQTLRRWTEGTNYIRQGGHPLGIGPHLYFMVALWNRATIYILMLWFVLSFFFFFSSPNLSRRRLDVCHTSTHGVASVRI